MKEGLRADRRRPAGSVHRPDEAPRSRRSSGTAASGTCRSRTRSRPRSSTRSKRRRRPRGRRSTAAGRTCASRARSSRRRPSRCSTAPGASDVIGMTNATEAKLCREAGHRATRRSRSSTDYDCWHEERAAVSRGGRPRRPEEERGARRTASSRRPSAGSTRRVRATARTPSTSPSSRIRRASPPAPEAARAPTQKGRP